MRKSGSQNMFLARDIFLRGIDLAVSFFRVTFIVMPKHESTVQSVENGQLMVLKVGVIHFNRLHIND